MKLREMYLKSTGHFFPAKDKATAFEEVVDMHAISAPPLPINRRDTFMFLMPRQYVRFLFVPV